MEVKIFKSWLICGTIIRIRENLSSLGKIPIIIILRQGFLFLNSKAIWLCTGYPHHSLKNSKCLQAINEGAKSMPLATTTTCFLKLYLDFGSGYFIKHSVFDHIILVISYVHLNMKFISNRDQKHDSESNTSKNVCVIPKNVFFLFLLVVLFTCIKSTKEKI